MNEGMIWHIGDGRLVKIWEDRWIPKPISFKVQSLCMNMEREATVSELIDPATKIWSVSLIQDNFDEDEG